MVIMMRVYKTSPRNSFSGNIRSALALLSACTLLVGLLAFVPSTGAQQRKAPRLTEEQRILHVLNRLGFGARPGDVERVKAMGLERYIDQQLHPEKIDDAVAEGKVKNLEALQLSTPELYAKYPQPNQLLRALERSGQAPPELAAVIEARKNGQLAQNPAVAAPPKMDEGGAMT